MLKRPITYTNFNDEEVTEEFYFNLSSAEMIEMEMTVKGGLQAYLTDILKSQDKNKLIREFKRIILSAYGEKSADGKHFRKSDEIREAFSQTAAFDALFLELCTNEDAVIAFIKGVLPKELVEKINASSLQNKMAAKLSVTPSKPPKPPAL